MSAGPSSTVTVCGLAACTWLQVTSFLAYHISGTEHVSSSRIYLQTGGLFFWLSLGSSVLVWAHGLLCNHE